MKKRRLLIYIVISFLLLAIIGIVSYNILNDKNKLTSSERTWINENINNVQNVYITKNDNIFSKDGSGVFYSFLSDLEKEYNIKLNVISIDTEEEGESIVFKNTKNINDNDKVFYKDHYVLVSNENELIKSNSDLEDKIIGVLNSEIDYIKTYLKDENINFNGYDTEEELFKSIGNGVSYIIVPRMQYIDKILSNKFSIIYHLNDINNYYVLSYNDDVFSIIVSKYFNKWENNIYDRIKEEEFKLFTKSLEIKETEIDKLLSIDYNYGFVPLSPYEINGGKNYTGIIASYLKEFSDFSKVNFNVTKYNDNNRLVREINKGNVDIFFGYDNTIKSDYLKTDNGINATISILTNKNSDVLFDSLYGLINEKVYVKEFSYLSNYLKSVDNIDIQTYSNNKDLSKLNKSNEIIVMDTYIYDYLKDDVLSNYVSKYNTIIENVYSFRIKKDYELLSNLLDKYINYLDSFEVINNGVNNHNISIRNSKMLVSIARIIICLVLLLIVIALIIYKKGKRIRVSKKIRKDDKIRFIDDLTMLKNRVYLTDFMKTWNNNTIYPQAVIVIGLNSIQEINEKYGVEEGDKQIQAASNALIKTQLDNSDLMRSDGNEFVIYSVGYNQKQIINYLHKLTKEFKKLPYNYGAEYGYRIIENDLTTIEDALTDATLDMKNKKESNR